MGYAELIITDKAEIGFTNVQDLEGCGIATILTILRFKDEGIPPGGYNIDKSIQWERNKPLREKAKTECTTIMYLTNAATEVVKSKCYLTAAIETGYKKLFSFKTATGRPDDGYENELKSVIAKFINERQAEKFVDNNGRFWYFCK